MEEGLRFSIEGHFGRREDWFILGNFDHFFLASFRSHSTSEMVAMWEVDLCLNQHWFNNIFKPFFRIHHVVTAKTISRINEHFFEDGDFFFFDAKNTTLNDCAFLTYEELMWTGLNDMLFSFPWFWLILLKMGRDVIGRNNSANPLPLLPTEQMQSLS